MRYTLKNSWEQKQESYAQAIAEYHDIPRYEVCFVATFDDSAISEFYFHKTSGKVRSYPSYEDRGKWIKKFHRYTFSGEGDSLEVSSVEEVEFTAQTKNGVMESDSGRFSIKAVFEGIASPEEYSKCLLKTRKEK